MNYMLLENGVAGFTLISTKFFETYNDAVMYWAENQYKWVLNRLEANANQGKDFLIHRYSRWGDLYEAKPGQNPKRIRQFHHDVEDAMTKKFV